MADLKTHDLVDCGSSLHYHTLRYFTHPFVVIAEDEDRLSTVTSVDMYMREVDGHMMSKSPCGAWLYPKLAFHCGETTSKRWREGVHSVL